MTIEHLIYAVPATGLNVPGPTCSVTKAISTPRLARRWSNSRVMCRPAVGAATAPAFLA